MFVSGVCIRAVSASKSLEWQLTHSAEVRREARKEWERVASTTDGGEFRDRDRV